MAVLWPGERFRARDHHGASVPCDLVVDPSPPYLPAPTLLSPREEAEADIEDEFAVEADERDGERAYQAWCWQRWIELVRADNPPLCPHGEKGYCSPCEMVWDRETSPEDEEG
jgi:hypothetical protein